MTGPASSTAPTPAAGESTTAWFALTVDDALRAQGVEVGNGLTSAEADARRAKVGPNRFTAAKKASKAQQFLAQYADPMQIVLLVAGIVCLFLPGQFFTGLMLLLLTLGNAVMGLNQESKASSAADALSQSLVVTAKTRRDGNLVDLPMDQLVPGDIVNLQAGDLVPADARILTAATLEIDESALTGESVPTPKQVDAVAADAALGDRVDMAFMNTQVTRGSGVVLVVTTGMGTQVGHISGMLTATVAEETPLTKQINGLTRQILVLAGLRAGRVDPPGHRPRRAAPGAVPHRGRVHDRGHPDGAPGDRHGHPVQGLPDARRGGRHREAAPLGRDPRVHLGAQLRQDRHAHDEPDDRRPDGHRRAALRDLRHRLLHRGEDHPGRRPARAQARALPAADGPLL